MAHGIWSFETGKQMTIRQSSITAYNQGVRSGKIPSQRNRILDLLKREGPMTNRMIGKVLRMELGSVSARVNAMLKSELVNESHYADCPHSGERVRWVQIAWPQKQLGMGI